MTLRCDRSFRHTAHTFVDDHDVEHQCDGGRVTLALAELLLQRPELSGVGVASLVAEIGVAAA